MLASAERYVDEICEWLGDDDLLFIDAGEWEPAIGSSIRKNAGGFLEAIQELCNSVERGGASHYRLQGTYVGGILTGSTRKLKNSVVTLFQELETKQQIPLQVCFCFSSKSRQEDADRFFLSGTVVVLREPLIAAARVRSSVGYSLLVVPSPADLQFVAFLGDDVRALGRKFFDSGQYSHARLIYGAESEDPIEQVHLLSGCAQACLQLGRYDEAIQKASEALEMDGSDVGSLRWKAQGLLGNREYAQALESLELAASLDQDSMEVEAERARCELLYSQSVSGVYDLTEFICGGLRPELAPPCADFVGPVEIRSGVFGRGVYLTSEVKKGQLLLVSNAIAHVRGREPSRDDLIVELVKACQGSSRTLAQLNALACSHDRSCEVPELSVFKPNSFWKPSCKTQVIDVWRMRKVIDLASFGRSLRCGGEDVTRKWISSNWIGVWGLPGLMNHSCAPTVSRTDVGGAMFVRAARDLSSGEELVWSYVEASSPWLELRRHQCYDSWGFHCSCERCRVEEKHQELVAGGLGFRIADATPDECWGVVSRLEKAMLEEGLEESVKKVLRGGYIWAYLSCSPRELRRVPGYPGPVELMRLVDELMPGCCMRVMSSLWGMVEQEGGDGEMLEEAKRLIQEEVRASYGELDDEAMKAFLEAWAHHGIKMHLQGHL